MVEGIDRSSQILSLVSDSLQVVSYKWLSRKFSISSNESKRLLETVAEKYGSGMDIIYAVSGWAKADRQCYSVKLVPKSKLQEAKAMLDGHVSTHVYSIQPCVPKDPAELWSAEYVQSEELFKQPSELNNCLRDNRFSAVSCSSATRKTVGTSSAGNGRLAAPKIAAPLNSSSKVYAPSSSSPKEVVAPSNSPKKATCVQAEVPAAQPAASGPSKEYVADVKSGPKGSGAFVGPALKGASGTKNKGDGALANLWGRASTKPKPAQVEAQVAAAANMDAAGASEWGPPNHPIDTSSDDEDASNFARIRRGNVKTSSKRTRRMIVDEDMSDEEAAELNDENIVSLSSPEVPKAKVESRALSEKNGKDLDASVPDLKEAKLYSADLEKSVKKPSKTEEDTKKATKVATNGAPPAAPEPKKTTKVATNGAPHAAPEPKKRKVVKTRVDERGREVTEVVWETENPVTSDGNKEDLHSGDVRAHAQAGTPKAPSSSRPTGSVSAKASNAAPQNPASKASGAKATGKGASKDAQQGRISSFFKKKS